MKYARLWFCVILLLLATTACTIVDALNFATLNFFFGFSTATQISVETELVPVGAVERYEGIPQSTTEDGFPQLGDPEAPVQMLYVGSFACIHCSVFEDEVFENLVDRIRAGDILYTYMPMYSVGNFANGLLANQAALCAAEQDAFWSYQETLYFWHEQFPDDPYTESRLEQAAAELNLDVTDWKACLKLNVVQSIIEAGEIQAREIPGFVGVPLVVINDEIVPSNLDDVTDAIDRIIKGNM
ncbi:MAG: DsbA family protein [Anaerolineae bacterium]|nr:DsbA family protein [Anaerolineae bacterium]